MSSIAITNSHQTNQVVSIREGTPTKSRFRIHRRQCPSLLSVFKIIAIAATAFLSPAEAYPPSCLDICANQKLNSLGRLAPAYMHESVFKPYGQSQLDTNPYSSNSVTNPYAFNTPKLYDLEGNYRGKLSKNTYDYESVSNIYGPYGSEYYPSSLYYISPLTRLLDASRPTTGTRASVGSHDAPKTRPEDLYDSGLCVCVTK